MTDKQRSGRFRGGYVGLPLTERGSQLIANTAPPVAPKSRSRDTVGRTVLKILRFSNERDGAARRRAA